MAYNDDIPGWMTVPELQHIEKLASEVPENGLVLEVGSFFGRSTWAWAKSVPPSANVVCVDVWCDYPVLEEAKRYMHGIVPDEPLFTSLRYFRNYTDELTNIRIIQKLSSEALPTFKAASYDVVFLDGMHTNPIFGEDLRTGYPLVKPGGILCGHDFDKNQFPDIVAEVTKLADRLNLTIEREPDSMIWVLRV